eukprot:5097503-Amphidinium_carterae.1
MISGRQAIVLSQASCCEDLETELVTEDILQNCCETFGIRTTGSMCLVSGHEVVPAGTVVHDWPGIQACGEISEYQLVVQQS